VPRAIPLSIPLSLAALLCLSCGGSQTAKPGASGEPGNPSTSRGSEQDEPQLPSCDDGSCFRCGEGICPKGFYCESNGGVTGCQWSTACAKAPTCACLQPMLKADPRCSCELRDGAAFVTCSK